MKTLIVLPLINQLESVNALIFHALKMCLLITFKRSPHWETSHIKKDEIALINSLIRDLNVGGGTLGTS